MEIPLPTLSRIEITANGHLLLVLSHDLGKSQSIGGSIQGFVYCLDMETWMRISDSRFMFSHFYSTMPRGKLSRSLLSRLDQTIRNSHENPQTQRGYATTASGLYANAEHDVCSGSIPTRAHCEDRMACAIILNSKADFQHWLRLYIRGMSMENDKLQIRFVVDMLLHTMDGESQNARIQDLSSFWWLSSASHILGLDRTKVVNEVVIPEMSKNRAMQRLTNEIVTEMKALSRGLWEKSLKIKA